MILNGTILGHFLKYLEATWEENMGDELILILREHISSKQKLEKEKNETKSYKFTTTYD